MHPYRRLHPKVAARLSRQRGGCWVARELLPSLPIAAPLLETLSSPLPPPCSFAALCQAASWFNFYCLTRTYSNSMEAALLTGAVYHWGLHIEEGRRGGSSRRGLLCLLPPSLPSR